MRRRLVALLFIAPLVVVAPARAQVTLMQNFSGDNLNQLPAVNGGFGYIPPDTMGAAGPTTASAPGGAFVEFTNGTFTVYNEATGAVIGSQTALTTFWTNAGITGLSLNPNTGTGTTDPHVLYDPVSSRWYAVTIDVPLNRNVANRILVAVSNTTDPTAGWKGYAYTNASSAPFADYPMVGIDNKALYITTNNFSPAVYTNNTLLVVPKADLLAGGATTPNAVQVANFTSAGFSPVPVVDYNGGGNPHLLLSANGSATTLVESNVNGVVNGAGNAPTISSPTTVAVTGNVNTQNAAQTGGPNTIDTGDTRFAGSVVFHQGSNVWAINTNTIGGREALVLYRFADSNLTTPAETKVIGDAAHDYYYGSVAVTIHGDIVIGYTRSGPSEFASAYALTGHFDGTTTTLNSALAQQFTLKEGTASYNITFGGARNRWGDYSQTTIDPNNPDCVWTIQEWASPAVSFAGGTWNTQIAEFCFTQVAVPEPGPLALGAIGIGLAALKGLKVWRRRQASAA
jgi:hypothetical protein